MGHYNENDQVINHTSTLAKLSKVIAVLIFSFALSANAKGEWFPIFTPSLLIDVELDKTSPGPEEQFCYKIRYRCASSTEHCTDAYLDLTLPEGMDVSSLPPVGGNISAVTISPASPSGTYVRIDLVSPPSAGAPANSLAAGSSGILSVCAKWICNDNPVQVPAVGSTLNIIGPSLNASNTSTTVTSPLPILVPNFNSCPQAPGSFGDFQKHANNWTRNLGAGGLHRHRLDIPDHVGPMIITDTLPQGLCLSTFDPPIGWTMEVLCGTNWISIPASYNDFADWLVDNETAGTLSNLLIDPLLSPSPANETGCSADTMGISTVGGHGLKTSFTGIRVTTPAGANSAGSIDLRTILDENIAAGTVMTNCMTTSDPAYSQMCSNKVLITRDGTILRANKNEISGLGNTTIPSDWPLSTTSIYPTLTKQNDDILWKVWGVVPQSNGADVSGFSMIDTLPFGLTFDLDPVNGNWFTAAYADKGGIPPPYDQFDQYDCWNPTFTTTTIADGRTVLNWNFNNCTYYTGFGNAAEMIVYFTTRYDKTIPLPPVFDNEFTFKLTDDTPVWCGDGSVTDMMSNGCTDSATSDVNPIGGDINTSKWVQGNLDAAFTRHPNNGFTNVSGVAIYELLIDVTSLEGIEKLEMVDILSHIGDSTLTTRVARNSMWSTELAGPLTFEKFDIITQSWVSAAAGITTELYATTYNPCYLDASLQVKTATGLTEPVSASCDNTDFSATNPIVGAKAFAIIWENTTDPLAFGELLRIRVPVRQLGGEAAPTNGSIASNSFATTATEPDGDELFSSEPLKVNLQMLDLSVNASFGDYVWLDANANGIQDPGELPIAGVVLNLYDVAGNPILVGGNPQSVTTDANGQYTFSGLTSNTNYIVRLDNPSDYSSAGPLAGLLLSINDVGSNDAEDSDGLTGDSGGLFSGIFPEINITTGPDGTHVDNYDFGFYATANICGYAWLDADKEGDQDANESPMDSVRVELIDVNGVTFAIDTTDVFGNYLFEDILPGLYTVQITYFGIGNYTYTVSNQGSNDNEDSDSNTNGVIGPVIVEGFDHSCNHDVGFVLEETDPATIIGTVWDELVNDGIQSAGELGVEGIQVNLLDDFQFVIATTYTDSNGDYAFENLEPNLDYYVNVVPGVNNPITQFQDFGTDDTVDSDVNPTTGNSFVITPIENEVVEHVDAGIIMPYSLGNLVWLDTDNNGLLDAGEGVVSNVLLYLYDASTNTILGSTWTDANGKYVFTNLIPGDYFVELILPNGVTSSGDIASSTTPNTSDNDDNGVGIISAVKIQSSTITIVAGAGNSGDPNWTETDHGLPINGAIDNTSNPKAYYTLDFGLQYKLDCDVPLVQYAITDGAISKPGQTTDYFYPGALQNMSTNTNHILMTQQKGVIRCFDYCEFGTWSYYFNPMDPEEYLFAIEHGVNVTPIEYIELRVEDIPADRYAINSTDATFVMSRDWFVRTTNNAPLEDAAGNPTTVNIRFYFPEEEFKEIIDAAIAQANTWGVTSPSVADAYWFKRTSFNPTTDIDATGSVLTPFDITTNRNAATTALGVNTADGVFGVTGNGKNHIQFNGINGFSGGTAAITINRIALPIAIIDIEAIVDGCNVLLNWEYELSGDYHGIILERSKDGVVYQVVNQLYSNLAQGIQVNSFQDKNLDGNTFYRLKLLSSDGTVEYSTAKLVEVDCSNFSRLNIYPNPIGDETSSLNVNFENVDESLAWVTITNNKGVEKMTFPVEAVVGTNVFSVDISSLSSGIYHLSLKSPKGKMISQKFVKINE